MKRMRYPSYCSSEFGSARDPRPCGRQLFRYEVPKGRGFKRSRPVFLCPTCDRDTLLAMGEILEDQKR